MDAIKFTCARCAYQFTGSADNRQCPSCHKHSVLSDCPICKSQVRSTGSRHRIYCSKQCMAVGYRVIPDANCLHCGVLFRPKGDVYKGQYYVQKYCTKACASEALRKPQKQDQAIKLLVASETRALRSIAASVRKAAEKNQKKVRRCVDCGAQEQRLRGQWHVGWRCEACSAARLSSYIKEYRKTEAAKTARRKAKSRRRAVERGAYADRIDPIAVFERDKWTCHLCGIKTVRKLRGTNNPLAPELDHIVTLAQGGTHTWGNVACACLKCNRLKGWRSMGQKGFDFEVAI